VHRTGVLSWHKFRPMHLQLCLWWIESLAQWFESYTGYTFILPSCWTETLIRNGLSYAKKSNNNNKFQTYFLFVDSLNFLQDWQRSNADWHLPLEVSVKSGFSPLLAQYFWKGFSTCFLYSARPFFCKKKLK
jgi:hypothetical protein